jgi:signal transduction histidine kinase
MRTQVRARRAAERIADELRASEEALRRANREKDDFLAIISHELRTPLNAIVGWTAMLRRGQVPADGVQHALEVIERNAAAQTTLVEDLLDISRAVAGRLRLEKGTVDVVAALRASIDAIKPSADARGVAVVADIALDLGTIHADRARFEQIVLNLLSNAVKFTESGGRATLSAGREGARLVVSVTDTGIGIDPEFLPHVFDRFRQADTSTTRTNTGVGLGLAIARHLVELHGGSISVSSPGHGLGSTFTVAFPIHESVADRDGRT